MANLAKWAAGAGVGLTWTSAFGTEINSLAAGSVAVSTIVVANGTALDLYADISFSITGTTAATGTQYLSLYLMPLNQDGTTYGDGVASGTVAPTQGAVANVALALGKTSVALVGMARGLVLPPGSFKLALVNNTSNAFAASPNTVAYRTYLENLNG